MVVSTKRSTAMLALENSLYSMGNLTSILIKQFKAKVPLIFSRKPGIKRGEKKGTWALLLDGKLELVEN